MPAVERTSAPSPAPWIRLSPVASSASMSARWLIDLSPGRRSSPRRRTAGWTVAIPAGPPPGGAARVSTGLVLGQPARADAERGTGDERIAVERADVLVDGHQGRHEVRELGRVELLLGVRERLLGLG